MKSAMSLKFNKNDMKRLNKAHALYLKQPNDKNRAKWFKLLCYNHKKIHSSDENLREDNETFRNNWEENFDESYDPDFPELTAGSKWTDIGDILYPPDVMEEILKYPACNCGLTERFLPHLMPYMGYYGPTYGHEGDEGFNARYIDIFRRKLDEDLLKVCMMRQLPLQTRGMACQLLATISAQFRDILRMSPLFESALPAIWELIPKLFTKKNPYNVFYFCSGATILVFGKYLNPRRLDVLFSLFQNEIGSSHFDRLWPEWDNILKERRMIEEISREDYKQFIRLIHQMVNDSENIEELVERLSRIFPLGSRLFHLVKISDRKSVV